MSAIEELIAGKPGADFVDLLRRVIRCGWTRRRLSGT